jgi:hypothetical protein
MALQRGIDGSEPIRPEPVGRLVLDRREGHVGTIGTGTLACPACDAPVAIGSEPMRPHELLSCPFCGCGGALRDFLSLAPPTRPARVEIRLVLDPAARTLG